MISILDDSLEKLGLLSHVGREQMVAAKHSSSALSRDAVDVIERHVRLEDRLNSQLGRGNNPHGEEWDFLVEEHSQQTRQLCRTLKVCPIASATRVVPLPPLLSLADSHLSGSTPCIPIVCRISRSVRITRSTESSCHASRVQMWRMRRLRGCVVR